MTPDLLERARGRVRFIGWVMLGVMGVGALFDVTFARATTGTWNEMWLAGTLVAVGGSGAFVLLVRSRRLSDLVVLHLGLLYEVAICLFLAVLTPWMLLDEGRTLPFVTWVAPVIIFFPLVVPSPPRLTLATAIAAGATRPLGLLFLGSFGGVAVAPVDYGIALASPSFAVVLAYMGSRIVHGLNVDLAKAKHLGSYLLEEKLGQGGMGEVWRAQHRFLARPAAVKLIRGEALTADPETLRVTFARFEREAQTTASLRSPHTIQLYDFGVAEGGAFYYVMELLDGLDVDELVTRFGPLKPARAIDLLRQICDSLGEAHGKGLVHRDLKPANLYVCRYGRAVDFIKVLDFGLVLQRETPEESPKLTADNVVGGTPAFIAPEQALDTEIDARVDIYQLGCVAYWMLTGQMVFEAETPMAMIVQHANATPEPPSTRTEQPLPPDLEALVLACLEKDPGRRPQDVDQLAARLAQCELAGDWTQERARRWWARHLPESTTPPGL